MDGSTVRTINDFAYRTSSLILKEPEGNKNYSPLSLYYALALATTGAESDTEKELLNLLGMPDSETLAPEIETNSEQILSIISTVCFYDQWINRFNKDKTLEDVFHLLNGEEVLPYELISSPEQIKALFEKGEDFHGEVAWGIPKFNFDSKFKFKEQLEALGVKLAFEPSANFTGITASNGSLLFIGICTNPAE